MNFTELYAKAKEWFLYFKSKWIIIGLAFILGSAAGVWYAIAKKPQYVANLSFVLDDEKSGGGLSGALGLASQFGFDIGGGGSSVFSGNNISELMKSRSVIEKTLLTEVEIAGAKRSLADFFIDFEGWRKSWLKQPRLSNIGPFDQKTHAAGFSITQDSIITEIYKTIAEGQLIIGLRDKKLSIIDAKMTASNELFSKKFVETLIQEVSRFYVETRTKKSSSNVAILQKQTDSVRNELNKALYGVADAMDETYNLNMALTKSRLGSQKKQIDVQANSAVLTELVKNLELSKIALMKQTPLIQIVDYPVLPLFKDAFGKRKGLMIGSFITTFLMVAFLTARKLLFGLKTKKVTVTTTTA